MEFHSSFIQNLISFYVSTTSFWVSPLSKKKTSFWVDITLEDKIMNLTNNKKKNIFIFRIGRSYIRKMSNQVGLLIDRFGLTYIARQIYTIWGLNVIPSISNHIPFLNYLDLFFSKKKNYLDMLWVVTLRNKSPLYIIWNIFEDHLKFKYITFNFVLNILILLSC